MNLDAPLPAELGVGLGTALFVHGTCFDPQAPLRGLSFLIDGAEQPVSAFGMPRLDRFRALHPRLDPLAAGGLRADPDAPEDPQLRSYRSGFWGLVRIGPRPPGAWIELGLRARLAGARTQTASLGRIRVAAAPTPLAPAFPGPQDQPRVAICMATFEPPPDLLARQLDSLRAQTHANWVCVISDDCSHPQRFQALRELVGDDPRFVVSRSPRRLGFYANFERALALAPRDCEYVALADQDDAWYPHKLSALLASIGDAQLVYSDARIVGRDGRRLADSYWERRRNNHSDLTSLLVANSVTGAASLFRRDLLESALPFPPGQFAHYHDHWLALVALACGGINYVAQPLYDYVQHGHAALGHAEATRITTLRTRLGRLRDDPRERVRVNRSRYFIDVMRLQAFAAVLALRCERRMTSGQRRALRRFLALGESWPALGFLARRAATELLRPRPQTLGAEWELLQALLWQRAVAATARQRPHRRLRLEALPPADLRPRDPRRVAVPPAARPIAEKIQPLELSVADAAPQRVNLLIPTIDLEHLFGGYIAKFNLALRLAERGLRVRLVTVDPVPALPADWRQRLQSYAGLQGLFDRVEVAFGRSGPLEVSRSDQLIATTWWTAHIAHGIRERLEARGFVYLIQEYEPFTFPMGSYAALARASYDLEHFALFSTELLREYFRVHRLGVFAADPRRGEERSQAFENAITPVTAPAPAALAARSGRRLLFYARPEPHAARNMYELGLLALQRAAQSGLFGPGWELHGIGSLGPARRLRLTEELELQLLPRHSQAEYAALLPGYDLGLALMYTPHPSLVPIEMAAAGMVTVTNTFETKTAEALRAISPNLIAGEPTLEGVTAALRLGVAGVEDGERRARGSAVNWSRDWRRSFHDRLLERVERYLLDQ